MHCSNCNARLSCGCQRRTARDGKACCSNCIAFYEKSLTAKTTPSTSTNTTVANPNIWGAKRYVNTIKK